ncbi:MAG: nicotinamide mononucleotide transporter [Bacteroidales bacterium]|jgi:nicotinamide mononucleotide transporter|nr:nicotinamide mononucleotide transporter [Bacteroidales bacterium]HNX84776.1 nicotinamide riboside transporter PnuC [Bacteroidales bacterium]HOC49065.1 nicotinamide riboside transporter PnuC [Bacteroidales bacterium]HPS98477.1 nicotinamide riboside transporter PnuC [Bacteroidales bacterium]
MATNWIAENIVEIFGAVTGIAYVILEIRRNILLWPLGIITSAVYIYVFGREGFYANMGLQVYYLVISIYGWYAWRRTQNNDTGIARRASRIVGPGDPPSSLPTGNIDGAPGTDVRRIDRLTAVWCIFTAVALWAILWFILGRATDSQIPLWDGLIASLSVVATWMLTRKYLEQWYVWIFANAIAVAVYLASGLYPTAVLFFVYFGMAIIGLIKWGKQPLNN